VGNWDPEAKLVLRIDLVSGDRDVLHDLTDAAGEDAIDGLEVDAAGNLFVCGPGGLWVISADGERLGRLELPEAPHNLTWGDADRGALYITALTSVYRLRPTSRP
jgi:sugar lactone lactonase YvrE